jgi:hypothetical protein
MTQNKNTLNLEWLTDLAADHPPPCLSLYQPTHRHAPGNQQDPIRFRNLLKELEASLGQMYPNAEIRLLLKPLEDLASDAGFWNHTLDGLAVFAARDFLRAYRMQRTVPELAIVADSFHTKPLRRFLQTAGRYQVLGISLKTVQLFEGNRDALDEVPLAAGVPKTLAEALGDERTEPHLTVASYGGTGQGTSPMRHGDGGRADQAEADAEKFFRAVDRAVLEHHSKPSGLPLILASLPEHHHLFHQVSRNPFLLAESIPVNPAVIPVAELQERAWKVVEPEYEKRMVAQVGEFAHAEAKGLGSADLAEVATATASGRVGTLLIEADRQIAGRLDTVSGKIETADLANPQADDLLDDLGELVSKMGGKVHVLPADRMPGTAGLAAIYRY